MSKLHFHNYRDQNGREREVDTRSLYLCEVDGALLPNWDIFSEGVERLWDISKSVELVTDETPLTLIKDGNSLAFSDLWCGFEGSYVLGLGWSKCDADLPYPTHLVANLELATKITKEIEGIKFPKNRLYKVS